MANNVKESYTNCDIRINGNAPNEIQFNGKRARVIEYNGKKLNDVRVQGAIKVKIYVEIFSTTSSEYKGYATISITNIGSDDNNAEHTFNISSFSISAKIGSRTEYINSNKPTEICITSYGEPREIRGGTINLTVNTQYDETYTITYSYSSRYAFRKPYGDGMWVSEFEKEITIDKILTYKG